MKSLGESPMPEKEKLPVIPDDPEQSKRFEETARALDIDKSGARFKLALAAIENSKFRPPKKRPST